MHQFHLPYYGPLSLMLNNWSMIIRVWLKFPINQFFDGVVSGNIFICHIKYIGKKTPLF